MTMTAARPEEGHNSGSHAHTQNPKQNKTLETKKSLESLLVAEIKRLTGQADVCVFALYDAECPNEGPIDYQTHERDPSRGVLDIDVEFDFEGIGVWYICHRFGDTYRLKHILVQMHRGRFVNGQVETFEGFWDEFPQFVAEDRWIKSMPPPTARLPKIVERALEA